MSSQNSISYTGHALRLSVEKTDPKFQFVPVNLHLQRMWALNDSIRHGCQMAIAGF